MNKLILVFSLLASGSFVFAQALNFTLADPQPDLVEIYGGSFASGDIDGDGDNDLLMAGISPRRETMLYLNDGSGNFTEMSNTPFPRSTGSVALLKDLDGDGDLDLVFAGNGFNIQEFTHVYLNNGQGIFTKLANPALPAFADSGAALEDVDGDGDTDLLIAVRDVNDEYVADVFLNDGNAVFTPSGSTVFTAVRFGAVEFFDAEDDGDADVIVSGEEEDGTISTTLYLNDGDGNYSESTSSGFIPFNASDVDAADIDDDGDVDVLMSGSTDNVGGDGTILYLNDGTGKFTELASANLQQVSNGSNEMVDFDNDGDKDIVLIGTQTGGLPNIYNIVYENQGNNIFVPLDTLGGEYIAASIADDFNGDGLEDLIIMGFADKTNFYWNTSSAPSSLAVELLSFSATAQDLKAVQLEWQTASEVDNDRFEVEESHNGRGFQKIGEVEGNGTTQEEQNYSFMVRNPGRGVSSYRLRQVDTDGQFTYSDVVSVNLKSESGQVGNFYPNPSQTGVVGLGYSAPSEGVIIATVFSTTGRLVSSKQQQVSSGGNNLRFDFSSLRTGAYIVRLQSGAVVATRKMMVVD